MLLMVWVSHTPHDYMNKKKMFCLMILIRLFLGDSTLYVCILQTEVSCRNAQLPEVIQQESKGFSEAPALAGLQLHYRPAPRCCPADLGFIMVQTQPCWTEGLCFSNFNPGKGLMTSLNPLFFHSSV